MFYFDSNTTVPLQCAAHFFDSLCWQDVVWLTVACDHNTISSQALIQLKASESMNVFRYLCWRSIQLLQRRFCGAQLLLVFFASLKTFHMSQSFDW